MNDSTAELVTRVYRFALRLTGDSHAAEDLTQEAMLRSLKEQRTLREPRALRVWLFRIASNLWIDQVRRKGHRVAAATSDIDDLQSPAPPPSAAMETAEEWSRVLSELAHLPPRQREVMYLHACEGLTITEIGDILQSSPGAVKTNLSLARTALRSRLTDLLPSPRIPERSDLRIPERSS